MSVYRVITRIIPLNSSESTFEPASFDTLTDGNVGEIKVLNLTEPQSGMKYRIERIEYVQNVGPGETTESVNKTYAEKLKTVPGFVQLKANDIPLNPYDKSFKLTLPKVLYGRSSGESSNAKSSPQNKSSDSFKISVVKNYNFNKPNPKKQTEISSTPRKREKYDFQSDAKSPKSFKKKYSSYLTKKIKNTVWRNKNKASPTRHLKKPPKQLKSFRGDFPDDCSLINNTSGSQNYNCPSSNYVEANKVIDTRKALDKLTHTFIRKALDFRITEPEQINNSSEESNTNKSNGDTSYINEEKNIDTSVDLFDDLEYRELIINVPEIADSCSREDDLSKNKDNSLCSLNSTSPEKSTINDTINSVVNADSPSSDSFVTPKKNDCSLYNQSENDFKESVVCNKYLVLEEHPLYELLISLKSYFVNGECLICGFIPTDVDFNASEHMESHIFSNSFVSCYICSCCDEKFASPRNLYQHALAREKSYKYMCSICLLKFKRKHYLMRHTAKSHGVFFQE